MQRRPDADLSPLPHNRLGYSLRDRRRHLEDGVDAIAKSGFIEQRPSLIRIIGVWGEIGIEAHRPLVGMDRSQPMRRFGHERLGDRVDIQRHIERFPNLGIIEWRGIGRDPDPGRADDGRRHHARATGRYRLVMIHRYLDGDIR